MNPSKNACSTCLNSGCFIKKYHDESSIQELIKSRSAITVKKGQSFILEGAPIEGLFFIFQGKVKVGKSGFQGKDQILRFARNGEIIGHRGFAHGDKYQIYAIALETTILCSFSTTALHNMMQKIPSLTYDLMVFYADELNKSETKVRKFAQMSVKEKVIDAILYLNRKFGHQDGFLNIALTRKEIADFAGTTEEQVIRMISALKKEHHLKSEGKKIGIIDLELLKNEISAHNFFLAS